MLGYRAFYFSFGGLLNVAAKWAPKGLGPQNPSKEVDPLSGIFGPTVISKYFFPKCSGLKPSLPP